MPEQEVAQQEQPNPSEAQPENPPTVAPEPRSTFTRWNQQSGEMEALDNQVEESSPSEPPSQEPVPPQQGQPSEQAPPLLAGKFKTPQELEKAYAEAQKTMHAKAQEAAEAKKQLEALQSKAQSEQQVQQSTQAAQQQVVPPIVNAPTDYVSLLMDNPQGFEQAITERTVQAATERWQLLEKTRETTQKWQEENKDLVDAGFTDEVGLELQKLLKAHPERIGEDMGQLLAEATGHLRTKLQALSQQAVAADRTVRRSVQSLATSSVSQPQQTPPAQGAAQNTSDPLQDELRVRREMVRRQTGNSLPPRR